MKWAYGVTTVPSRKDTTLPKTLHSLCDAGFGDPRLFVDGCDNPHDYDAFQRPVTCRPTPPLRIVGNFMLGLAELYVRDPMADRYAMFQDDVVCVINLREYLSKCTYPRDGYLNLYTYHENFAFTRGKPGWNRSNQRGLGALGLVFNRDVAQKLMESGHMIRKPASANHKRSWKALDGGIVSGLKAFGVYEYVHNPSLVQHIGTMQSTLDNNRHMWQNPTEHFPGVNFDALELLK
jgi:hypothetical protein